MAQWEVCRVVSIRWLYQNENKVYGTIAIDYYSPAGVITKFPSFEFGRAIGVLSAAEWELTDIQHRLIIRSWNTGSSGELTGRLYYDHPSGDKSILFDGADVVAYFKRPMQAGRKIDDAL